MDKIIVCVCVRANERTLLLMAEGQWMQTLSPLPILPLPDASCEALKHNYTAEVSVVHTRTQSSTQAPGAGRTLRFVVPGEMPLQGSVNQAVAGKHNAKGDRTEKEKLRQRET